MARKKIESQPTTELPDGSQHYVGTCVDPSLRYIRCEWVSDYERCRYPGTLSPNTRGGGPWFCRGHFGCDDPVLGAQIVSQSNNYARPTYQNRISQIAHRAEIRCRELGLVTLEQKRKWLLEHLRTEKGMKIAPDFAREGPYSATESNGQ